MVLPVVMETVKIVSPVSPGNPHGYIVINKSDLKDGDEIFGAKKHEPKADLKPEPKPESKK